DAVPLREAVPAEWPPEPGGDLGDETGDQVGDRSVLRPVLLTLVVVVLLGMLGTGLWLIFNRAGGAGPGAVGGRPPAAGWTRGACGRQGPRRRSPRPIPVPRRPPTRRPRPNRRPQPRYRRRPPR